MKYLEKINDRLNRWAAAGAGVILVSMILLTFANIVLRKVWMPVRGTYEIMGFAGAVLTALAMGITQKKKEHIHVDILFNRFPGPVKQALGAVNTGICAAFFSVAGWFVAKKGHTLYETGEVSETLRIVYYPFAYVVAAGCFLLAVILFTDMLLCFGRDKKDKTG
ncbi:TRAP transporter small permease [Desulfospira joergensenii]|uniref:TRAP transporter small permease n=1 Tax=Desulfospira joergensenii TaxID=53329 RepID=UPI0003B60BA0|nr:TRAP transporter small permease [Desulfospira joergensenii]